MNTPTHIIISHAGLGNKFKKLTRTENWAVFLGAFLPDAAIFVLFFYALIARIPMETVWNELYFTDFWTNLVDYFNSIPITAFLICFGIINKWRWLWLFGSSSMLHIIADFFTHSYDAHQHFLPFSNWRFISPVSYYEVDKFGLFVSVIEILIIGFSIKYISPQIKSPKWRKVFKIATIAWIIISSIALVGLLVLRPDGFGN